MAGGAAAAGALPAGMGAAVGMAPTAAELGTTAAGAGISSMPMWQQGLMGALTGSTQYGKNAPMIHQAIAGMLQRPQQQAPMMGAPMRPQVQPAGAFPGLAPQQGQTQPFGQPPQIQSLAPWMSNGLAR